MNCKHFEGVLEEQFSQQMKMCENCFYCIVPLGFLPGTLLKKTSLKAYIVVFVAGVLLRTLPGALISAPTRTIPFRA